MDTPYISIDLEKLKVNIKEMAEFAGSRGLKLRPHIKAHKIPEIAHMQMEAGAIGITVAKLGEAEVMFSAGIDDILVAYPLIGQTKMLRIRRLVEQGCKLSVLTDSKVGALQLNELALSGGIDVLVKVDSGLGRCGFPPGGALEEFVFWLKTLTNINFRGLITHAGHAYGCSGYEEVQAVGVREGELMVAAAESLRRQGIDVDTVSIGSTPTARAGGSVKGVAEIRPGNYVFYDATQVALGVVGRERCSLRVYSTVVSRPEPNRAIIDAGAKVLALDRGAHGGGAVSGHGILMNDSWTLSRLSEEHGVIEGPCLPEIGTIVDIIPNHACPVVNLSDSVLVSGGQVWRVAARGRVR
jgi:D-serine deaminase-like pyridoxal phosphate-dependent protein